MAEIDGLESCPFCPFAIVIENPDEKLFHCLNDACKKITCRNCKRPVSWPPKTGSITDHQSHIPKRCDEMDADDKLDRRHAIEEAMSNALMRKCPNCSKPYIKETGCNKMTVSLRAMWPRSHGCSASIAAQSAATSARKPSPKDTPTLINVGYQSVLD
jgi:TRIAD3 protein (E3 ubiquitin-protein ligase RNF216)